MDFLGLLPTSGRLSSLYMPLQLLGTYLKMKIEKYCFILYEHVISFLVCYIISKSGLNEAYQCLLSMVKLVEKQYGQKRLLQTCIFVCIYVNVHWIMGHYIRFGVIVLNE